MTKVHLSLLLGLRDRVKLKHDDSYFNKSKWAYRLGIIDTLIDMKYPISQLWFNNVMKYDK